MDLNTQLKLDKFFSQFKLQSYPKASLLIEPDKQREEAFGLKKGIVRCYA